MEPMLAGKTCLITGAGRGIGRSAALLFAAEGGRVVLSDRDEGPACAVVEEIRGRGGEAVALVGDVTADGFAEQFVTAAVDAFGPTVDVLVNNAGFTWDAVVHRMTDEQWETMWKVHCTAPFRLVRAASPYLRDAAKRDLEQGRRVHRKVVNVSSVAGTDGNPGQANYASAKAGIIGFTKTLAREWGRFQINVNAVAFGWIDTRLTRPKEEGEVIGVSGKAGTASVALGVPRDQLEVFRAAIPLGRPGTAEEAAGAILFLASPLSDYVSGHVLKVSGGG